MKNRIILFAFMLIALSVSFVLPVYGSDSDVTLVVDTDNSGGSSGGGSHPGDGGGGGSGGSTEKPNKPDKPAGGEDGSGNDYYLRPGIDVDSNVRKYGYM